MPNSIALFKNYVPILDEVYREASRSAVLDGAPELARAGANAGELIIPKMTMDGLADYARASGYVDGDVTLTNETVLCNFDRGRMFTVDALDDAETAGIAFGRLASEFIRTRVVPELDAFRFACYAAVSGIGSSVSAGIGASSSGFSVSSLIFMHFQIVHDIFAALRRVAAHEKPEQFRHVAHIFERDRLKLDLLADKLTELLR